MTFSRRWIHEIQTETEMPQAASHVSTHNSLGLHPQGFTFLSILPASQDDVLMKSHSLTTWANLTNGSNEDRHIMLP